MAYSCKKGGGGERTIFWVSPLRCKSANHQRFLAGFLHHTKTVIYLNLAGFWWQFSNNEVKNEKFKGFCCCKKDLYEFFIQESAFCRSFAVCLQKNEKSSFTLLLKIFVYFILVIMWWVELGWGRLTDMYSRVGQFFRIWNYSAW